MPRLAKSWHLTERFNDYEDLQAFILTKKVHKRSSKTLKSGVKVEYECNHKKRFECKFEMYSFVASQEGAQYEAYECEEHTCETAEFKRSLKRAAREMIDLAIEVRKGAAVTSGLARELIKAKDIQLPGPSIVPGDSQLYNAVARKKQKIEGPPVLTIGDFITEMKLKFPEGDENTPPDTVICPVLDCDPQDPNALFAFMTTPRLLQTLQAQDADVLQVDGTYKLVYENNTVLTLGISDQQWRMHPVGLAIIGEQETTEGYRKLFEALKLSLSKVGLPEFAPKAVMLDGAASITAAVSIAFPGAIRLTCYFHMKKQVKVQMPKKGVPKDRRKKILEEIMVLQLAPSSSIFLIAATTLLKRWRCEGLRRFSKYFQRVWVRGSLCNWFEGAKPGSVSTNNGLHYMEK